MDNKGWISLHRRILEWEWYSDINTCRVFIHLLLKANHKDNKWRGVTVKQGQLIATRFSLSRETGLSEQNIKTALKKLKSTNEITTEGTNKYTLITIVNYDFYQDKQRDSNQQNNQRPTSDQPTANQQLTTNNNVNNVNKKYSQSELDILDFWNSHKELPTHSKDKKGLHKNIKYAINNYGKEDTLKAIRRYVGIYRSSYEYDHKWSLDNFCKQSNGVPNYLDDGQIYMNFAKWYKSNKSKEQKSEMSEEYKEYLRKRAEEAEG